MPLSNPIAKLIAPLLMLSAGAASAQQSDPVWTFYGHLNIGVLSVDDGFDRETGVTDNDNSNSRIGLIYRRNLDNGSNFRFHFETAIGLRGSSSINGASNSFGQDYRRTELRKFEFIYETPNHGTFYAGQGSIATDGFAEADFSGTSVIAYSSLQDQAGSQVFRVAGGGLSGVTVGNAFSAFDGARRFRFRYDTPRFNGFQVAISGGREILASGNDDEFYDLGLRYDKDYGDYEVAGRLGYSWRGSAEELLVGSAALLHKPTGLSLSVASGSQQKGDASYVYVKAGLQRDWWSFGRTHLSIDVYEGDDFNVAGSSSSSVGLAAVQKIDKYNLEIYASHRIYDYRDGAINAEDLDVTFVGARWRF